MEALSATLCELGLLSRAPESLPVRTGGKMGTQVSFSVNPWVKGCEHMKSRQSIIKLSVGSSMSKKALQALGAMLVMLLLCIPALSQGSSGRILGTITDANGGAIPRATVTILDV